MATFSIRPDKYATYYDAKGQPRTPEIAKLIDIMKATAAAAPPSISKLELFSGLEGRATGTGNHPHGWATDIQLYDANGKQIWNHPPNYSGGGSLAKTAATYPIYEQVAQIAHGVQQQKYPEFNNQFRWGGYFVGGVDPLDLMHFDVSATRLKGAAFAPQTDRWQHGIPGAWKGVNSVGVAALKGTPVPPLNVGETQSGTQMPLAARGKGTIQSGSDVEAWQKFLASAGHGPGAIDGKFGDKTDAATKAFQKAAGLTADGVVGPQTLAASRGAGGPAQADQLDAGLLEPGNIDLNKRPIVHNADGTYSTVRSMSFGEDGKEVLIPTVAAEGSGVLSNADAIKQYRATGQHLGKFTSPATASAFAERLHQDQAALYGPKVASTAPLAELGSYVLGGGTLRKGSSGRNVAQLQTFLNANGAKLAVDGDFGQMTKRALQTYQANHGGLTVDGVLGPQTLHAMVGATLPAQTATPAAAAYRQGTRVAQTILAPKPAPAAATNVYRGAPVPAPPAAPTGVSRGAPVPAPPQVDPAAPMGLGGHPTPDLIGLNIIASNRRWTQHLADNAAATTQDAADKAVANGSTFATGNSPLSSPGVESYREVAPSPTNVYRGAPVPAPPGGKPWKAPSGFSSADEPTSNPIDDIRSWLIREGIMSPSTGQEAVSAVLPAAAAQHAANAALNPNPPQPVDAYRPGANAVSASVTTGAAEVHAFAQGLGDAYRKAIEARALGL